MFKICVVFCKVVLFFRGDVYSINCKVDLVLVSVEDISSFNYWDVDIRLVRMENDESNIRKWVCDCYVIFVKIFFIYLFVYMVCILLIMCMVFKDMMFCFDFFYNRKIIIFLGVFVMMILMVNFILYFWRF